jgi:transcriptional regulator with XRE-family HTH domain
MQNGVNTKMQKTEISFPDRLKELRKEKTQIAIAKELQVNQQTYARWELGDRQPKLQDLASIALHFGVTTDWLLGLPEVPQGAEVNIDWKKKAIDAEKKLLSIKSVVRNLTECVNKLEGLV